MKKITLIVLFTALWPLTSQATLMGDTIDYERYYSGSGYLFDPAPIVVTGGVEYTNAENCYDLDISATSIRIDFCTGNYGGGTHTMSFFDLDWVDETGVITNVALSTYDTLNLTQSDVSFGDDYIQLSISSLYAGEGGYAILDITGNHSVPAPASMLLLGTAMLGLALRRRNPKS